MPDNTEWPTGAEVYRKCMPSASAPMEGIDSDGIDDVLAGVIAEFQSPAGPGGYGGTGRRFDTVVETRTFDGNGYSELFVGDIVPGTPLSVSTFGSGTFDGGVLGAVLRPAANGLGNNFLVLAPLNASTSSYGYYRAFPRGVQNIAVSATWGFAATVPKDVYEAVISESAARSLVQFFVPLTGVGEQVTIGSFNINTSSGISVWGQSSPIAVYHTIYQNAIRRYRVGNAPALKQLAASRRMS